MKAYWTIAIAGLIVAGCAGPQGPQIGVAVSASVTTAARLAADDYCKAGRAALRFGTGQSSSSVEQAVINADSFALDGRILVVVGHANSAASIAAARIYQPAGLPQIAPTTTAAAYSEVGRNMFRLVPDDHMQAELLARYVARDTGTLVIAYVNDDYGRGLTADVTALLPGVTTIAFSEEVDKDNVTDMVKQIVAERPARLLWLGRTYPLSEVLPGLRLVLPGLIVTASDGLDAASVKTNVDGRFTGLRFVRLVDPEGERPELERARGRLTAGGLAAGAESLLVYDGVALACAAIAKARSRRGVREYLASIGNGRPAMEGSTGQIRFDARRNVSRQPGIVVVGPKGLESVDVGGPQ